MLAPYSLENIPITFNALKAHVYMASFFLQIRHMKLAYKNIYANKEIKKGLYKNG